MNMLRCSPAMLHAAALSTQPCAPALSSVAPPRALVSSHPCLAPSLPQALAKPHRACLHHQPSAMRSRRSTPTPSALPEQQPSTSGSITNSSTPQQQEPGSAASSAQDTPVPELPPYGKLFVAATLPLLHALAAVLGLLGRAVDAVRNAVATMFPQLEGVSRQDVRDSLRGLASNVRLMAFIAPLARAASSESLTAVYARTFERAAFGFAKMYLFCLFMRVLLSWFPEIDWNAQPWTFLRLITEPYLQIYRGLLPPLFGQLDFTPLFGFLILQDVVEVMAPTYTMGLHDHDTSTRWTTSDVMCYLDGF